MILKKYGQVTLKTLKILIRGMSIIRKFSLASMCIYWGSSE